MKKFLALALAFASFFAFGQPDPGTKYVGRLGGQPMTTAQRLALNQLFEGEIVDDTTLHQSMIWHVSTGWQVLPGSATNGNVMTVYNVQQYGALGTLGAAGNDTVAISNAFNAVQQTGGVLYFPGATNQYNYYGFFGFTNHVIIGFPWQYPIVITGDAPAGFYGAKPALNGYGSAPANLNFFVTNTPIACIDTRAPGTLTIQNMSLANYTTTNPIIFDSQTVLFVRNCMFYGGPNSPTNFGTGNGNADAIVLGGTYGGSPDLTTNSPFAGYGGIIWGNAFNRVGHAVLGQAYVNQEAIEFNQIESYLGDAAIKIKGTNTSNLGALDQCNMIIGNNIELTGQYGIWIDNGYYNYVAGNIIEDGFAFTNWIAGFYLGTNTLNTTRIGNIVNGSTQDGFGSVPEIIDHGTNNGLPVWGTATINGNTLIKSNVIVGPTVLSTGGSLSQGTNGLGMIVSMGGGSFHVWAPFSNQTAQIGIDRPDGSGWRFSMPATNQLQIESSSNNFVTVNTPAVTIQSNNVFSLNGSLQVGGTTLLDGNITSIGASNYFGGATFQLEGFVTFPAAPFEQGAARAGGLSLSTNSNVADEWWSTISTVGLSLGFESALPFGVDLQAGNYNYQGQAVPINLNPLGGNVGIGTTNPTVTLTVNGAGSFSNTVTSSVGFVGDGHLLTALNASQLASGTIPYGTLSGLTGSASGTILSNTGSAMQWAVSPTGGSSPHSSAETVLSSGQSLATSGGSQITFPGVLYTNGGMAFVTNSFRVPTTTNYLISVNYSFSCGVAGIGGIATVGINSNGVNFLSAPYLGMSAANADLGNVVQMSGSINYQTPLQSNDVISFISECFIPSGGVTNAGSWANITSLP